MKINIIDINIAHASNYNGTLEADRTTKNIQYCRPPVQNYDGITILTDKFIDKVDQVISKYCVAWIMEPRAMDPKAYSDLESNISSYDLVLTYDKYLIDSFPNICEFIPADGLFVDTMSIDNDNVPKVKNISHIYSKKQDLIGHQLRHKIAKSLTGFDSYGNGTGKTLEYKSDALNDYRFSIIIENNQAENYFTEKILDCFACRTVPVYWGAPNIGEFFDLESIITFNTIEELESIIPILDENMYDRLFVSLQKNYQKALEYYDYDEIIYQVLKKRFPDE